MINYTGLSKAQVLAGLYNRSQPQGMGFLQYDPTEMTVEEAQAILLEQKYFDYLKGRVMKVDLSNDTEFEERLYDRDNGEGAAQKVLDALFSNNQSSIKEDHQKAAKTQAHLTLNRVDQKTRKENVDGIETVILGLADCKDTLIPAVHKALDK